MKRKLTAFLMALSLCLLLCPGALAAGSDFEIEKGVLVAYLGEGGDVVIPDDVTAIGNEAFADCATLTSVTIPGSVKHIGDSAFLRCTSLKYATVSEGVETIGLLAFSHCAALENVKLPASLKSIGVFAFFGCTSFTQASLPDGIGEVPAGLFFGCTALESVYIPESAKAIGDEAFEECSKLTTTYYGGSEEQWGAIEIDMGDDGNDYMLVSQFQYNSERLVIEDAPSASGETDTPDTPDTPPQEDAPSDQPDTPAEPTPPDASPDAGSSVDTSTVVAIVAIAIAGAALFVALRKKK